MICTDTDPDEEAATAITGWDGVLCLIHDTKKRGVGGQMYGWRL